MISIHSFKTGLVSRVDGNFLILDLPKGGSIRAPNMGAFEIGEEVAFTMDATGKRVVLVMPKEMAEFYKSVGENELLQLSLKEDQNADIILINDDSDNGPVAEIDADCRRREFGEVDFGWADYFGDEHIHENTDGSQRESRVFSEGSGEADLVPVSLLHGHDGFEEVDDCEFGTSGGPLIGHAEGD